MKDLIKCILIAFFALTSALAALELEPLRVSGPNCLNAVLMKAQILKYPRYTSNSEMRTLLRSRLCKPILPSQDNEEGVIGLVIGTGKYAQKNIISHAYIFVDNYNVFEKVGYDLRAPYRLVSEDQAISGYDVGEYSVVEKMKCMSLKNFIDGSSEPFSPKLLQALALIEESEKSLYEEINNQTSSALLHEKIKNNFNEILNRLRNTKIYGDDQYILRHLILTRMVSIAHQLSVVGEPALRAKLVGWEIDSAKIESVLLHPTYKL